MRSSKRQINREGFIPVDVWLPLLLGIITFLVYWPSLKSDFVYDAPTILQEKGFVTSLSNLPAVLSLKVMGMDLKLADRPGQLLYLMLIAAIWGKAPWGYHLCSNLLHAVNVALLFVFLRRLIPTENGRNLALKVYLAIAAVTLIFALHPISVETVAAISYSSDLLVTFFTLLALLMATIFDANRPCAALLTGGIGSLCALAAVTCKESGMVAALLLIVYWLIFRRNEAKGPWLLFLGTSVAMTSAFLVARFSMGIVPPDHPVYLGGSFFHAFSTEPRLWIFMMGKLVWPAQFSADYTLQNLDGISTPLALIILCVVLGLQGWLAFKSRLGALGVAVYWVGLMSVSNFVPLYRPLADRFYYLPMVGVTMQLLAALMILRSRRGFWIATILLLATLLPLTFLTLNRQAVFASDLSLWTDTLQVSPLSSAAQNGLGFVLAQKGQLDDAIVHYEKALEINPGYVKARNNLGQALAQKGRMGDAIIQYEKVLEIYPHDPDTRNYLGLALARNGQMDEAINQFQIAVKIDSNHAEAHNNLGNAFAQKGKEEEAIIQYQKALEINPAYLHARSNLGNLYLQMGRIDQAIAEFQKIIQQAPNDSVAQANLAKAQTLMQKAPLSK